MDVTLIEFKEGKRTLRYLVDKEDIKDFNPVTPKAIDKQKLYDVKWQKSLGEDESRHDGFYPGKILLVGATTEEVLLKAQELKIRNIQNAPKYSRIPPIQQKSSPIQSKRKSKEKVASERDAKRRRMEKTLRSAASSPSKSLTPAVFSPKATKEDDDGRVAASTPSKPFEDENGSATLKSSLLPSTPSKPRKSFDGFTTPLKLVPEDSFKLELNESPLLSVSKIDKDGKNYSALSSTSVSDCSDDDDATVQLEESRQQLQAAEAKIEDLLESIANLKNEAHSLRFAAKSCQNDLIAANKKHDEEMSALKSKVDNLLQINFEMQQQLFLGSSGKKSNARRVLLPDSSPEKCFDQGEQKEQFKSDKRETSKSDKRETLKSDKRETPKSDKRETPKSDKRETPKSDMRETPKSDMREEPESQDFISDSEEPNNNSESEEENIVNRICKDLMNKERLPIVNDKVYLGSGIYINEKSWNDKIRKQAQDTIMVKDTAQAIYGKEAMAQRTIGTKVPGKQVATPKKIKLITGVLKGKLKARGATAEEEKLLTRKVPGWLSEKFYDSSRKSKSPKSPKKNKDKELDLRRRELELKEREEALKKKYEV